MSRVVLTLLAGLLVGCGFDAEIVLLLSTDITTADQASVAVAFAVPSDAVPIQERCICLAGCDGAVPEGSLPSSASLRPGRQGEAPFRVVARGYRDPACGGQSTSPALPLVESKAKVRFVRGTSVQLTLRLSGACVNVVCSDPATTCNPDTGACVDDSVVLPPVDPSLDFSTGVGSPDAAGPDGAPDLAGSDLAAPPVGAPFQLAALFPTALDVVSRGSFFTVAWTSDGTLGGTAMGGSSTSDRFLTRTAVDLVGNVKVGQVTPLPTNLGYDSGGFCASVAGSDELYIIGALPAAAGGGTLYEASTRNSFEASPLVALGGAPHSVRCAGAGDRHAIAWIDSSALTGGSSLNVAVLNGTAGALSAPRVIATGGSGVSLGQTGLTSRGPVGPGDASSLIAYTVSDVSASRPLSAVRFDDVPDVVSTTDIPQNGGDTVAAANGPGGTLLVFLASTPAMHLLTSLVGSTMTTDVASLSTTNPGLAIAANGNGYLLGYLDGDSLFLVRLTATGAAVDGGGVGRAPAATPVQSFAMASDPVGNVLVVWNEHVATGVAGMTTSVVNAQVWSPTP